MEIIFDKIDRFFDRIKRMNVVKFFLLTWVIHFSWTLVAGITLALRVPSSVSMSLLVVILRTRFC